MIPLGSVSEVGLLGIDVPLKAILLKEVLAALAVFLMLVVGVQECCCDHEHHCDEVDTKLLFIHSISPINKQ